jgi:hypothetical protein
MNHGPDDICARCKHFKMKEYPQHAKVGIGRCFGYDNAMTPLKNPFTPWSTKACARYRRDWDERRDAWIAKQQAKEEAAQETISRASAPTDARIPASTTTSRKRR